MAVEDDDDDFDAIAEKGAVRGRVRVAPIRSKAPARMMPLEMSEPEPPSVSETLENGGTARNGHVPRSEMVRGAPRISIGYRADVDGLRAIAVLSVLIFHVDPKWLPGGFVGVDIFFVISGYVVTASLLRETHSSGCDFLLAFYSRRVKRLAPALTVVVAATSVLIAMVIPPWNEEQVNEYYLSGMFSLVGWANMHYATLPTGYFDEGTRSR